MTITINGTTGVTYPAGGTDNVAGSGVGTTDTQTLTNKTLTAAGSNTVEATSGPTSTQLAGMRNKIINGAMMIDQRNAGASVTPTVSGYSLDRWVTSLTQASKYSFIQNSTAPIGHSNSLLITSLSSYSVLAGDFFLLRQYVEGFNFADLSWGTANAQTVTLSFWVRSSLTGTFGGSLQNSAENRSYPFTYTITASNTWEQKSITITGDTSGTWVGATNGVGVRINFGLGVGSTYSGTAGSWAGADYRGATGATSVVGTNGATFYITGVQLEKGATATPFENRLYGTELALCQRYCWNMNFNGSQLYYRFPVGFNNSTTQCNIGGIKLPVSMRAVPSFTYSGNQYSEMVTGATGTSLTYATDGCSNDTIAMYTTYTSGTVVANNVGGIRIINSTTWYLILSAEL